ncbi:hypothetical protein [Piscinibacter sakaiensis]|uniref:hypothetical protein n=1 Tax=Piscinibacter sakaiensis TaxID=1547922 RepID=UPI003AAAADB6
MTTGPVPASSARPPATRSWRSRAVGAFASILLAATASQASGTASANDPRPMIGQASELRAEARTLADWAVRSGDNHGLGFLIVDKPAATVHVFDRGGNLQASSPVLLGLTPGDDTVPGIGNKPIAQVREHERTTPAGRFVAERGRNAKGVDVVWVDYEAGVSMHRVINDVPAERRLERLATPTAEDNRISYGCINVPVAFYESLIQPMFVDYRAVVYILPERKPLHQVFAIGAPRQAATAE